MSEQILSGDGSQPPKGTSEREERHQPDPAALVGAVTREMSEPRDGLAPTPVALVLLYFALTGWGGYYLSSNSGGFSVNTYDERFKGATTQSETPTKVEPMVLGRRTYNLCTQCHQENGLGLPGTYPPLAGSEIVLGDPPTLARILLHGLHGDLRVAGMTYNGLMPAWDRLSDVQIAAVLTYIRATWTNSAPPIDAALVPAIREQTSGRAQPWTWAELQEAAKTPPNVPPADGNPPTK